MPLEDVICRIGSRARKDNLDAYVFSGYSSNSPGISLQGSEQEIMQFLEEHPQKRYVLFGLGGHNAWKRIQNPLKTRCNGVVASFIKLLSPSPDLNLILLRSLGVDIKNPPKALSREERHELKVSVATHCQFDYFFPELISIGYGTQLGWSSTVATHANLGGFWVIGSVDIGIHVLVGANSVIGPGVSIGDWAEVQAGSYVYSDIPEGMVYGGNPARKISDRQIRKVELDNGVPRIMKEPAVRNNQ